MPSALCAKAPQYVVRMPDMYALYACLIRMYIAVAQRLAGKDHAVCCMFALYVCLICMPYMYVCMMPYMYACMYAIYVCLIYMPYTYVYRVPGTRPLACETAEWMRAARARVCVRVCVRVFVCACVCV